MKKHIIKLSIIQEKNNLKNLIRNFQVRIVYNNILKGNNKIKKILII